jgi:isoleucyl-tRNA synthetase
VVTVDPSAPASIHFCDYPSADEALIDTQLEQSVAVARTVVALGRRLREEHRIKVRQPLGTLTVVQRDPALRARIAAQDGVIRAELNVKGVLFEANEDRFARVTVKPNFATLGKRCGKKLGPIKKVLDGFGAAEVAKLEAGESIEVEGEAIALGDVLLHREATGPGAIATDGQLTVVLDTTLTPALVAEGHAREVVSQLQNARKGAGLEVSDRIVIDYSCSDQLVKDAIEQHKELILGEVLGDRLSFSRELTSGVSLDVNGTPVQAQLTKA